MLRDLLELAAYLAVLLAIIAAIYSGPLWWPV
ncbi:hypothetical protein SAMN06265221_11181 [Paracoccus laeviglucosivorans]|uniref:Uncharacterized protein n=1 Tax=Paracoccus laeviglucosivorans TaxID=1197861 RepID=A0A521E6A3_9RHOB|nr:hypothetical protein SAMN06265221_11181 [Paracoccus laeviglucosivorans]